MRKLACVILSCLAVLGLSLGAHAGYYYYEDFEGSGNPLHGQLPDVSVSGATWIAHSSLLDNGTFPKPVAGSANGVAAVLPFQPWPGQVYTLEAKVLNNHTRWVAIGFLSQYPNDNPAVAWNAMDWQVRHSNSGYLWALTRTSSGTDQEIYNGFRTAGQIAAGDLADPADWVVFTVVLDTTQSPWTATYYLNGVQRGATQTLSQAIMDGIKNVGISVERRASNEPDVPVLVDYFFLTPEPASIMLLSLAGAMTLIRRRSA